MRKNLKQKGDWRCMPVNAIRRKSYQSCTQYNWKIALKGVPESWPKTYAIQRLHETSLPVSINHMKEAYVFMKQWRKSLKHSVTALRNFTLPFMQKSTAKEKFQNFLQLQPFAWYWACQLNNCPHCWLEGHEPGWYSSIKFKYDSSQRVREEFPCISQWLCLWYSLSANS